MKKLIIWPLFMLAMTISMAIYGETPSTPEPTAPQDSTLDVIAWFNKHDTAIYRLNKYSWKLNGADTIFTAAYAMIARITVVDSTAKGYKMDYTILDFPKGQLPDSASTLDRFQYQITEKLARKIVGTTVHFETDEYGRITKYNNLGQIKKQAKSLFKEALNEYSKIPEIKGLKEMGFDIMDVAKNVDTDKLVDGYLEELNMLFTYHGLSMQTGVNTEHEEATDAQYENTTCTSVSVDADNGSYSIEQDVTNVLPRNEVKGLVGGIVGSFSNDIIASGFNADFDTLVNEDCTYEDYLKIDYMPNGWPYSVVREKITMIGNQGKAKQTFIYLDSFSFAQ